MKKFLRIVLIIIALVIVRQVVLSVNFNQNCTEPASYYRRYADENQLKYYDGGSLKAVINKFIDQFSNKTNAEPQISTVQVLVAGMSPKIAIIQLGSKEQGVQWKELVNNSKVGDYIAEFGQVNTELVIAETPVLLSDFQKSVRENVCK